MSGTTHVLTMFVLPAAMLLAQNSSAAGNSILDELISTGLSLSPRETVTLPQPILADGLSAAAQRQAIEDAARGKHTWETLTRRAVVAPFLLKITGGEGAKPEVGRRVDLSFVAYGNLDYLGSDEFLSGQFLALAEDDAPGNNRARLLSDNELAERQLPPPKAADDPRWLAAQFTVLDRVQVRGTTRSIRTRTSDSLVVASMLDPRFERHADHPNAWRALLRDSSGREHWEAWQTYSGLGSYVKVTQLVEPKGALFIEYHVAFAEPQGWFRGANLLRSKLPIVAQDAVRKFRRHLEKR